MLEVFKKDAAEKEQEYIVYNLKCTYLMNLWLWVQRVRYLLKVVKYLPCLADHKEAPKGIGRIDKPLAEVELCGLILRANPNKLADAYRVGRDDLVPTNSGPLLTKLEK